LAAGIGAARRDRRIATFENIASMLREPDVQHPFLEIDMTGPAGRNLVQP
jgi:hypothetical protein